MERIDIKSMDMKELQSFIEAMGEKKFRAKQLYSWMHQKLVTDFDEMTNLSKAFRDRLKEKCSLGGVQIRPDLEKGRYPQVFNGAFRWQYGGDCADEISSRQQCLRVLAGWLPDGLPFLCLHRGRTDKKSGNLGDLRSDLRD